MLPEHPEPRRNSSEHKVLNVIKAAATLTLDILVKRIFLVVVDVHLGLLVELDLPQKLLLLLVNNVRVSLKKILGTVLLLFVDDLDESTVIFNLQVSVVVKLGLHI